MKYQLLTIEADAKTVKGAVRGFMTAIVYLSPSDLSGVELCALAELAGCRGPCLGTAGRGGMAPGNATFTAPNGAELPDNAVQRARLRRTVWFNTDRAGFMAQLVLEIKAARKKAARKGLTLVVRPNGTSDNRYEAIPCELDGVIYPNIFAAFPDIQFYDYTKIPNRRIFAIPNYHLTFSYSHRPAFAPIVVKALKHYGSRVNFAAVFSGALPAQFLGRPVVNGDETDLRFMDAPGNVIGLKAKGRARRDRDGFVVPAAA